MDSANVVISIPSSGGVVSAHGVICSIPPVKIISLHWPPVILQSTGGNDTCYYFLPELNIISCLTVKNKK